MVILRRAPRAVVDPPELDPQQQAARADEAPVVRVLGGPGTGRTTLAVEIVVDRVERLGLAPEQCLVLAPTRLAAAGLRQRITARLGRTVTEPLARTAQAFAFAVLRREAALYGDPAPRLLSGPEQDVVLRELLAGHLARPDLAPHWPERVRGALATRGFRGQLRDLLMRSVEHGLDAPGLAQLGVAHDRPEWVAAARVLDEYDQVTALSRPGAYDPAWIATAAADLLDERAEARARLHQQVRLVVVDDAHELTWAAARLLRRVIHPGAQLVLLADPDSAVQTFRGADPRLLWWAQWPALVAAPTHVLLAAYRTPEAIHAVAARVAAHIGAVGGGAQRAGRPVHPGGRVVVAQLRAAAQEAQLVASTLRRAHLHEGVPWSQMAVIVRGRSRGETLRRVLSAAGVPVSTAATDLPVRDEVAVRPLLVLLELALRGALHPAARVTPDEAAALLLSPIGGADAVSLRRLRRHLRRQALDGALALHPGDPHPGDPHPGDLHPGDPRHGDLHPGDPRHGDLHPGDPRHGDQPRVATSDELLAALLTDPARAELATAGLAEGEPLRRLSRAVRAGVRAAPRRADGTGWAPGVSAETVLWEIWSALELAGPWRADALRLGRRRPGRSPSVGAARAARAGRDLDAVLGLFDAAARFADRLPMAGPDQFLDHIRGEEVPGDTLLQRAPTGGTVELLTPAAAAGRQWQVVCVAGVQEGVWPDLRLRGSLLATEHLVDIVTGRSAGEVGSPGAYRAAQAAVRHDETRLLHVAVTRAQQTLLVTAVRSDDEQPSGYLDVLDPLPDGQPARPFAEVGRPLTLAGLVGQLRRDLASPDRVTRARSARVLALLADEGVPGADPAQWWGAVPAPAPRPRRPDDAPVRVSPSKIEQFARCQLQWLLLASGGSGPSAPAARIGTLVHDVVAELGDVDERALVAEIDRRWPQLGLPPGWVSDRRRDEAHDMVARLARYFPAAAAAGWERVGVELPLAATLGRAEVTGKVDRLERRAADAALRVVDYKTGATKTPVAQVATHPQLAAYQAAVEAGAFAEHGSVSAGAALLQIGKNARTTGPDLQEQPPLRVADDPGWAAALVEQTAAGMGGAGFVASPGPYCDRCPVRTSCPTRPEGARL
jgi:superfamily I DNA/RNA helicase/RecB family exonuclease